MRGGWLLVLALLAPLRWAEAHSELRRSVPADGAVLSAPPAELRLVFNEPVQVTLVRLMDAEGQSALLRRDGDASASREEVAVPAAPLRPGTWRLEWRAISADGHPIRGLVTFRVAEGP